MSWESILSLVLLMVIWLVPKLIKGDSNKKKAEAPTPNRRSTTSTPKDFEEQQEIYSVQDADQEIETLHNPESKEKIKNEEEYFTYEREGEALRGFTEMSQDQHIENMQDTENKKDNSYILTLDEEEVYKGIIYSEILKKKYN